MVVSRQSLSYLAVPFYWSDFALFFVFYPRLVSGESLHDASDLEEALEDKFGGEWSSTHLTTANGHAKRKRSETSGKSNAQFSFEPS